MNESKTTSEIDELSLSIDEKIYTKDEINILKGKLFSRIYLAKN